MRPVYQCLVKVYRYPLQLVWMQTAPAKCLKISLLKANACSLLQARSKHDGRWSMRN